MGLRIFLVFSLLRLRGGERATLGGGGGLLVAPGEVAGRAPMSGPRADFRGRSRSQNGS